MSRTSAVQNETRMDSPARYATMTETSPSTLPLVYALMIEREEDCWQDDEQVLDVGIRIDSTGHVPERIDDDLLGIKANRRPDTG